MTLPRQGSSRVQDIWRRGWGKQSHHWHLNNTFLVFVDGQQRPGVGTQIVLQLGENLAHLVVGLQEPPECLLRLARTSGVAVALAKRTQPFLLLGQVRLPKAT